MRRSSFSSHRHDAYLLHDGHQRRARRGAHRGAALHDQRLAVRDDAQRAHHPLSGDAGPARLRGERTARDRVRARKRHRGLAHQRQARIGRGRRRLAAMGAQHGGADVKQEARHILLPYVTTSAPAFTVTLGPVSMMVAPCPLLMVMPTSLIEIIAPVIVLSRMPPVGPGMSLMSSVFCIVVCSTICCITGGT